MKPAWISGLLAMVLLTGCTTDLYYWGRYEDVIHYAYAHSDDWDSSGLIRLMEEDRARSLEAEKPLPPGWHAHLGLLYYTDGQPDSALQEFQTEKRQFPESGLFMDRLLGNVPADPGLGHTNSSTAQPAASLDSSDDLAGS
jgi:hypothetical protein